MSSVRIIFQQQISHLHALYDLLSNVTITPQPLQAHGRVFSLEEELVTLRRKAHVEQANEVRTVCLL